MTTRDFHCRAPRRRTAGTECGGEFEFSAAFGVAAEIDHGPFGGHFFTRFEKHLDQSIDLDWRSTGGK